MKSEKKIFKIVIALSLLLSVVNTSYGQNGIKKEVMDMLTKVVDWTEQVMEDIDKTSSAKYIITRQVPYEGSSKKIPITVDVREGVIRKLSFSSYDESFTTAGKEMYYFDNKGTLISHVNKPTGTLTHVILSAPYVMIYSKSGNKLTNNSLFTDDMAYLVLAQEKYIVDYYLSNFTGIKYSTFNIDLNESFIVKTVIPTNLYSSPNFKSPVVKRLPKGYGLHYLDRSEKQDSLPGKEKWIWLKVRDNKKAVGWVWGHPSVIKTY
ncbi:MAG: SH3 domain-containing protein [Sediminibacterium sp.]|nr:SH3 domain-containing protein [Sediminibacterium sp.]